MSKNYNECTEGDSIHDASWSQNDDVYEYNSSVASSPLTTALNAVKMGFPVFPVNPKNKVPLIKAWPQNAALGADQIQQWWEKHPNAMVGACTGHASGIFVLDIDTKGDDSVEEKLAQLEAKYGAIDYRMKVATPSGGLHLYCQLPDGVNLRNSTSKLGVGIDIRATGGYVIFPGSVRADGNAYRLLEVRPYDPASASNHGALIAACMSDSIAQTAMNSHQNMGATLFAEGRRDTDYTALAGMLRRKGAAPEQIAGFLMAIDAHIPLPHGAENIHRIANSVARYTVQPEGFSHDRFATFLAGELQDSVRYCEGYGFLVYQDGHWQRDPDEAITTYKVRMIVDQVRSDLEMHKPNMDDEVCAKAKKGVKKLESGSFMRESLKLLKTDPAIRIKTKQLDAKPHLINMENGTFNLETGELQPFAPEDYLTVKLPMAYDADAQCPNFDKFMSEIQSPENAAFLLRVFGYAIAGHAREQCYFVLHGIGKNGKSTLLDVIQAIFKPFVATMQPETINGAKEGQIRNDLARLAGTRIMLTSETRQGTVLDAPLLKQITGGDMISARFLHQEYFEFKPICVPFIITNYLPVLSGGDSAMARRLKIVPFEHVVPVADKTLPDKLQQEMAGIFNRVVQGHRDYVAHGLAEPAAIAARNAAFMEQSDLIKGFLDECVQEKAGAKLAAGSLYRLYQGWCQNNGYRPMSMNQVKESFERYLGGQSRDNGGRYWPDYSMK